MDAAFICLQEVKSPYPILMQRLEAISPQFVWNLTHQPHGSSGAVIRISKKQLDHLEDILMDRSHSYWVGYKLGGPDPISIISSHTGASLKDTIHLWQFLSSSQDS